jgi:hypothetical protein
MTDRFTPPPISRERPLFTWLVRIGVLANLAIVLLITYVYLAP